MIVGILLAAGAGHRFGGQKLLVPLAGEVPMVIKAARSLGAAVDKTLAVVRPGEDELARILAMEGVAVTACANADQGMGVSLAEGVKASPEADGWVIALGDMPFIRVQTHRRVVAELVRGTLLVAPTYQGRRGHPVGFANALGRELCQLEGDRGARTLLRRHRERLTLFDCPDAGILRDIDVPADLDAPR